MIPPAADPLAPLSANRAALLVIDVQERFAGSISGWATLLERVAALCDGSRALGLPIAATEQYVKGLGRTAEPVKAALGPDAPTVEKMRFSALTPEIRNWLDRTGRSQLILCGIEAHVCVLQTALEARRAGISTWLATDAISAGQPEQVAPAMHRMQRAGCTPTGIVSCLYEMATSAEHPAFKSVLNAAKRVLAAH
jgi:nicotinamidase-related amidase